MEQTSLSSVLRENITVIYSHKPIYTHNQSLFSEKWLERGSVYFWMLERAVTHLLCGQVRVHTGQLLASPINHPPTMLALCFLMKAAYYTSGHQCPRSLLTPNVAERMRRQQNRRQKSEVSTCSLFSCRGQKEASVTGEWAEMGQLWVRNISVKWMTKKKTFVLILGG